MEKKFQYLLTFFEKNIFYLLIVCKKNIIIHIKTQDFILAERAKAKGIEVVVFDRGGYVYHGRVQALAEGAREGGLQF